MRHKKMVSPSTQSRWMMFLFSIVFILAIPSLSMARISSPLPEGIASKAFFQDFQGQSLYFYVTGSDSGSAWGSGIYTADSKLGKAAVHAGLLDVGERGIVKVNILPGQDSYTGTTANGVTTSSYGRWDLSYSLEPDDGGDNPVLQAPMNLLSYTSVVGGVYFFRVTAGDSGTIWGTNVYTADSTFGKAVIHAGLLNEGEEGVVRAVIVPGLPHYVGSTANGIKSLSYNEYRASYTISIPGEDHPLIPYPGTYDNPVEDPINLSSYEGFIGGSFYFMVTGSNSGRVWGTDFYTTDSHLATAAVHAGLLAAGQRGMVKATILSGRSRYEGSTRNGVRTLSYGAYRGTYTLSQPDGDLGNIPVVTSPLSVTATVGDRFSYQVQATNSPTYIQVAGLPEELTVSDSGLVTGTPLIEGTFPIEILVSNHSGTSTSTLYLVVNGNGSGGSGGSSTVEQGGSGTQQGSGSGDPCGTVAQNLDIFAPSLDLVTNLGVFNLRAEFIFVGDIDTGNLQWKLGSVEVNDPQSDCPAGTVSMDLDIHIPSASFVTPMGVFDLTIDLGFVGQNASGDYLWNLTDVKVN